MPSFRTGPLSVNQIGLPPPFSGPYVGPGDVDGSTFPVGLVAQFFGSVRAYSASNVFVGVGAQVYFDATRSLPVSLGSNYNAAGYVNGNRVSRIIDQTLNTSDVTQSTAATQPTSITGGPFAPATGIYWNFNATTLQYLLQGSSSGITNSATVTYVAWVNFSNFAAEYGICGDVSGNGWQFAVNASGNLIVRAAGGSLIATSTGALTAGTWVQVAVAISNNALSTFYINGVAAGTFTPSVTLGAASPFVFGASNDISQGMQGGIAELIAYNTQLSATVISNLFNLPSP